MSVIMKRFVACSLVTMCLTAHNVMAEPHGFLTADTAPDSLRILPPPPPENSIAFLNDKAAFEMGRTLREPKRQTLAAVMLIIKIFQLHFLMPLARKYPRRALPVFMNYFKGCCRIVTTMQ